MGMKIHLRSKVVGNRLQWAEKVEGMCEERLTNRA